jgi:hypothetical protein
VTVGSGLELASSVIVTVGVGGRVASGDRLTVGLGVLLSVLVLEYDLDLEIVGVFAGVGVAAGDAVGSAKSSICGTGPCPTKNLSVSGLFG